VLRLALTYALADGSHAIELVHLEAALAHSTEAERPFHRKPNTDSASSRTPRSEATRLPC
jgi:hypothetical protein